MISPIDRLHLKSVKLAMVRKLTSTTKGSAQSGFGRFWKKPGSGRQSHHQRDYPLLPK